MPNIPMYLIKSGPISIPSPSAECALGASNTLRTSDSLRYGKWTIQYGCAHNTNVKRQKSVHRGRGHLVRNMLDSESEHRILGPTA